MTCMSTCASAPCVACRQHSTRRRSLPYFTVCSAVVERSGLLCSANLAHAACSAQQCAAPRSARAWCQVLTLDALCACRLGNFFPQRLHARDAIPGKFYSNPGQADVNTLCGAVPSGPSFSESYKDSRAEYSQSEPAIDYAAGALCAFGAYAAQASSALSECGSIRTPFTGRS